MERSPLHRVEDAMVSALTRGELIRDVLVGPKLWLGFLLAVDLPECSKKLKEIKEVDGHFIVSEHMERIRKHTNYDEEIPFRIRFNPYVEGVRILIYL